MSARRAFTLTEVLLAIAMIAAMAGLAAAATGLFSERAIKSKPADRVFLAALKTARNLAAERGEKLSLSHAGGVFTISRFEDKSVLSQLKLSDELPTETAQPEVVFVPKYPQIIGSKSAEFNAQTLSSVEIAPDGTCTPVEVRFKTGDGEQLPLAIDPMCCAAEVKVK